MQPVTWTATSATSKTRQPNFSNRKIHALESRDRQSDGPKKTLSRVTMAENLAAVPTAKVRHLRRVLVDCEIILWWKWLKTQVLFVADC